MKLFLPLVAFPLLWSCASSPPGTVALFDGVSLRGWRADVPAADSDDDLPPAFVVRDGLLVSQANPQGHLITDRTFRD